MRRRARGSLSFRVAAALSFSLLWAGGAFAQGNLSPDQLKQIGQAAAASQGVPWSIFESQIAAESSWNANVGCNSSGACGIAQFIPGTAAQYGVNTSDPTSSLYGAAVYDAQLYQQTGSWSGVLTRYTGGLTPSNPGNASYAAAFTAAAQADAGGVSYGTPLSSSGGMAVLPSPAVGGISPTGPSIDPATLGLDGSILSGPGVPGASPPAPVVDPPTFRPCTWIWTQWQQTVQQPMQEDIRLVAEKAGGIASVLVLITISLSGIGVSLGLKAPSDFIRKVLKCIAVVAGVGAGGLYQPWFVDIVNAVPGWMGQGFNLSSAGANGPAAHFDNVITSFIVAAQATMKEVPYLSGEMFLDVVMIGLAAIGTLFPDVFMFAIWFAAQVTAQMLLIIGGVMCLFLLSGYTEHIFFKYVHAFIGLALIAFMAIIMTVLALQLMVSVFAALPKASAATMSANLLYGAIAIIAIALILAIIWKTIEHITTAAGVAQAAHTAQTMVARSAAAAGGPAGAAVSNIVQFPRSSSPVGRSVSGGRP